MLTLYIQPVNHPCNIKLLPKLVIDFQSLQSRNIIPVLRDSLFRYITIQNTRS